MRIGVVKKEASQLVKRKFCYLLKIHIMHYLYFGNSLVKLLDFFHFSVSRTQICESY